MQRISFTSLATAALLSLCLSGCHGAQHTGTATATRAPTLMLSAEHADGDVGTVRRLDLMVAYYRSDRHGAFMQTITGAHARAAEQGDTDRAGRIEAFGAETQEIAHRQLAGDEPLYTVLLGVQDELRAVMSRHGLCRVVEAGPGVEGIDITDELIALLPGT